MHHESRVLRTETVQVRQGAAGRSMQHAKPPPVGPTTAIRVSGVLNPRIPIAFDRHALSRKGVAFQGTTEQEYDGSYKPATGYMGSLLSWMDNQSSVLPGPSCTTPLMA